MCPSLTLFFYITSSIRYFCSLSLFLRREKQPLFLIPGTEVQSNGATVFLKQSSTLFLLEANLVCSIRNGRIPGRLQLALLEERPVDFALKPCMGFELLVPPAPRRHANGGLVRHQPLQKVFATGL